jgi:hypothetical protein
MNDDELGINTNGKDQIWLEFPHPPEVRKLVKGDQALFVSVKQPRHELYFIRNVYG